MTAESQPSHLRSSPKGGGERKAGLLLLLLALGTHWVETGRGLQMSGEAVSLSPLPLLS